MCPKRKTVHDQAWEQCGLSLIFLPAERSLQATFLGLAVYKCLPSICHPILQTVRADYPILSSFLSLKQFTTFWEAQKGGDAPGLYWMDNVRKGTGDQEEGRTGGERGYPPRSLATSEWHQVNPQNSLTNQHGCIDELQVQWKTCAKKRK